YWCWCIFCFFVNAYQSINMSMILGFIVILDMFLDSVFLILLMVYWDVFILRLQFFFGLVFLF
ncbi:hypothetical protein L9G16_23660, partial [Shewanella sp. A25]|nr:hypothetical protein [Shewanella shenzhenensis]